MKVIRKEREQYDAYQWTGKKYQDYIEFDKETDIISNFNHAYYDSRTNEILLNNYFENEIVIKRNEYIIFDNNGITVLPEKEFKEQYEVVG